MRFFRSLLVYLFVTSLFGCGGGGGGASCSNMMGEACPDGQYCSYDLGQCGEGGKCVDVPVACDAVLVAPVCSCEGISFFSECYAFQAGQSIQSLGNCPNV